jgi:peptidoglycan/xylan/chitin deacetylase (PgdA/CDA1 family)
MTPDKLCALTFDDGPDAEKTPLVLDRLERYGAVATFMMVGHCVNDATRPVIERVVSLGCEIGNHAWGWESMDRMTDAEIRDSIRKTSEAIARYAGKEPRFFRPPNLAVSDALYDAVGLPFVDGVIGRDWAGCGTSAEARAQNVLSDMRDGAIILLHDVQPDPHPTPEALDILIPELKYRGYEFVTLSELFARKGVTPDPNAHRLWKYVE